MSEWDPTTLANRARRASTVAALGVVLAAAALWRLRRHQRWLEHLEGIVDPGTFS